MRITHLKWNYSTFIKLEDGLFTVSPDLFILLLWNFLHKQPPDLIALWVLECQDEVYKELASLCCNILEIVTDEWLYNHAEPLLIVVFEDAFESFLSQQKDFGAAEENYAGLIRFFVFVAKSCPLLAVMLY